MTTFFLAAALMLLVGYLLFLPTLYGRHKTGRLSRAQLNLSLHHQRQREIEQEAANPQAREQLAAESERNLLGDLESAVEAPAQAPNTGRASVIATLVILPILALLAYYQLGRPDLLDQPPAQNMADMSKAIDSLTERLQKNPNDLQGWILLGRSLQATRKPAEAARAFEFALKLSPEDLELQSNYAQTLAESSQGSMAGKPEEIVQAILKKDPKHKSALWLAGIAAAERGDMAMARTHWTSLQAQFPPDSPEAQELASYIDKTHEEEAGASVQAKTAAPAKSGSQTGKRLHVKVSLSPSLKGKTQPEDTVFIFAKAAKGPPMPLAVVKKQVRDLPLEILLDDSMSMMEGMNLSRFDQLIVGARVSKTGQPIPSPGDLEGLTEPVSPGKEASYTITIDHIVPEK